LIERGHETREETRKAWLFRVAYHEAMAVLRRRAVGDKVIRKVSWQSNGDSTTADDCLVKLETIEAVRDELAKLRPQERQIVRMRIYEEKSFLTIAEELQIPIGTALGRMRTALMKLRERLKGPSDER
jgi:RNA polymerase sigma-70 factor (ECF subfamily)